MTVSIKRRAIAPIMAALALTAAVPTLAQQAWKPSGLVTMLVPYSPGGGTDAQARAVGRELSNIWGQPVIIENVPGADGLIGTRRGIGATPDGHTLLVNTYAITLTKHLPAANGFDPMPELVPVSVFSQSPGVFAVNSKLPGNTLAEVIGHCKSAAKPCSFATTESVARLQAQMLRADEGLNNLIVANYKGGGQAIVDLVAGTVDMSIIGITAALPHYKSGTLKVLATLGTKRTSVMPEVPSALEAGIPGLDQVTWYGMFAPKGTPQNVVDGIATAVAQAVRAEGVKKTFSALGVEALGASSAESSAIVRKEMERWDGLTKRFSLTE